jgi:hypothetical protein
MRRSVGMSIIDDAAVEVLLEHCRALMQRPPNGGAPPAQGHAA